MVGKHLVFATRLARRQFLVTCTSILLLAIVLTANSAVFSIIEALLLRPLPVRDLNGLVAIEAVNNRGEPARFSYRTFEKFRAAQSALRLLAAYDNDGLYNIETNRQSFAGSVALASENFYSVINAEPSLGRGFGVKDDGAAVAVISDQVWRERYRSSPAVLGQTVNVEGRPFTIIGVQPRGFPLLGEGIIPAVLIPVRSWSAVFPTSTRGSTSPEYSFMGRLPSGITLAEARAQLDVAWKNIREDGSSPVRIVVSSGARGFTQVWLRRRFEKPILVLQGAGVVLLLAVCASLATLLLARFEMREKELTMRLLLGARPSALFFQCAMEGLLLSLPAGLLAACCTFEVSRALANGIWQEVVPLGLEFRPDVWLLVFMVAVAILTGLFISLVPAWGVIRGNAGPLSRGGTRVVGGGQTLRRCLIGAQIALSVGLLYVAALLQHSLTCLRVIDTGFPVNNLYTVELMRKASVVPAGGFELDRELIARVRQSPGVMAAAWSLLPAPGRNRCVCPPALPVHRQSCRKWRLASSRRSGFAFLKGETSTKQTPQDGRGSSS